MHPFYDPKKSYEENFEQGPFGAFADGEVFADSGNPSREFLGQKVFAPFGIPAGPLINGKYVKAALDKGFDLPVYKTVRSKKYPCHRWPNVLSVQIKGDLTPEKASQPLIADEEYKEPISITNSFGVPSFDPDFWQPDLADAVKYAKKGQVVIGSFQGTVKDGQDEGGYIADFVATARLVKETGVKMMVANFSCPNEGTANLLCFDIKRAQKIARAIKEEIGNTPFLVKTARFENDAELKEFVSHVGKIADGIISINTIPAEIRDKEGNQALPGEGRLRSGVCGHAIKWAGLDMVKRLVSWREKMGLNFVIVGCGGVAAPDDYKEYVSLGADAVMSATGAMWNPMLGQEIKRIL